MSLQAELHEAHKARLARIANAARRRDRRDDTMRNEKTVCALEEVIEQYAEETEAAPAWDARHVSIQRSVASHFGVTRADLIGECRRKKFTVPRHIAIYLVHTICKRSLPWIGHQFGGMDHTSVLYAVRKIEGKVADGDGLTVTVVEAVKAEVTA